MWRAGPRTDGARSGPPANFFRRGAVLHHLVDQAKITAFLSRHVSVTLQLALDRLDRLAGVADIDLVQPLAQRQDLPRLDLDSYMSAEESRDFGIVDEVVESRPLSGVDDPGKS